MEQIDEKIERRVVGVVAQGMGIDPEKISPTSNLVLDLGADSLDVVQLVMAIEDAFGITVPDDDFPELQTLRDMSRYVANCA